MDESAISLLFDKFMVAIQKKNVNKMFRLCQVTYKSNHAKRHLEVLTHAPIDGWALKNIEILNGVHAIVKATVVQEGETVHIEFVAIKEIAPYTPRITGVWGINPISILKKLKVIDRTDGKLKLIAKIKQYLKGF